MCETEVCAAPVVTFIAQAGILKYVYAITQLPTKSFEGTPVLLYEVTYCRQCLYMCETEVSAAPVATFIAQAGTLKYMHIQDCKNIITYC